MTLIESEPEYLKISSLDTVTLYVPSLSTSIEFVFFPLLHEYLKFEGYLPGDKVVLQNPYLFISDPKFTGGIFLSEIYFLNNPLSVSFNFLLRIIISAISPKKAPSIIARSSFVKVPIARKEGLSNPFLLDDVITDTQKKQMPN